MEHLPTIDSPAYSCPKVEDHSMEFEGLVGFPERLGWIMDRQLRPVRTSETATLLYSPDALIKAWLFFGLLSDFFGISELDVDMHDFVGHDGDQNFVTSCEI